MFYLILAICFSVSVSILLKLANNKQIVIEQAIAINYLVAILCCYLLLTPNLTELVSEQAFQWHKGSIFLFIALGILLPSVFVFMAKAVQYAGIVRADVAQRLSLFLQIIAAVLLFNEQLTQGRIVGIILAFLALFCLLNKPTQQLQQWSKAILFLLLVWLGYAIIGILFKVIAKMGQSFSTALFIAFILAGGVTFCYLLWHKTVWQKQSILVGVLLGSLNFFNILFYIKAHQYYYENPTLVFAGMDIGVICVATVIGALYFKEKISKTNGVGLVLGVGAIFCLFYL